MLGFHCRTCGEYHPDVPLDWGPDEPFSWKLVRPEDRGEQSEINDDLCVLQRKHFFVRGRILIPIHGREQPFVWLVWCSLSEPNFQRTLQLWEQPGREQEPPYFGWLDSALPGYPQTAGLKTHVHTQPVGQRPLVELEPTDHPLAVEQRNGITWEQALAKVEALLHG